uniref:TFIIi-associated transactivator factor p17 n=1 Tax=Mus musculus TaxID=10090 RepID=Q60671_MOUSE|nr:TFIIi-associated transactivator factor p17 [Mus musculus]
MKTSSGSFEQSFPVAALSSCKIIFFSSARLSGTNTCKFSNPGICTLTYCFAFRASRSSRADADSTNSAAISRSFLSILAKPRALEALSLASWKSSLSARLISMTDLLSSSAAPLSSALVHSSAQLSCRPDSRKLPVDFSSIPAMSQKSFPACASPPRI